MTDIPYIKIPAFFGLVYRLMVDIEEGDECREDWTGRACLCVPNADREWTSQIVWQLGMTAGPLPAPEAEPWRPPVLAG